MLITINSYILVVTIIGLAALGMAWMPAISEKFRVSYAIVYVLLGVILYSIAPGKLPLPLPIYKNDLTVHITEIVVIISIMGTGLKIDRPFTLRNWRVPFRLISITMLLSIASVALLASFVFGLDPASAILLGAVLAPTDPVLASDVQVGPPNEEEEEKVKFALTAEAGMNDGTAFPFTWLAVGLALVGSSGHFDWQHWVLVDLIYRIVIAVVIGLISGKLLGFLLFKLPEKKKFIITKDGFVALSATLFVYGITEIVHAYGFIAVFVTAVALRNYELEHQFHRKLHAFTDQIERIMLAVVLLLFGGSLVSGILNPLTWKMAIFGIAFVFIIRPLTGMIGLAGLSRLRMKQRLAISFFGIRGIGSFFYLAFAFNEANFQYKQEIWALVSFIVLVSIVIHGLTAGPVMNNLEE